MLLLLVVGKMGSNFMEEEAVDADGPGDSGRRRHDLDGVRRIGEERRGGQVGCRVCP